MRKRIEQARESRAMTEPLHGSIEGSSSDIEGSDKIDVDVTRAGGRLPLPDRLPSSELLRPSESEARLQPRKTHGAQAEPLVDVTHQCHWIREQERERIQGITVANEPYTT